MIEEKPIITDLDLPEGLVKIQNAYPSTEEINIMADLLEQADDELKVDITRMVKHLFICMYMATSVKDEAFQSFMRRISAYMKKKYPQYFQ